MPAAEFDSFRCRYNPKASSPCVLALREGKDLVFYSLDPILGRGSRLGKIEVASSDWARGWDLSPDGSHVALVDPHKYGGRIEVLTLSDGTCHELSPELQGHDLYSIGWAADGKSFLAVSRLRDSLDLLHVTLAGKVQTMLSPEGYQNQFLRGPLASPDGRYLAFKAQTWDGNVWMIDNFR